MISIKIITKDNFSANNNKKEEVISAVEENVINLFFITRFSVLLCKKINSIWWTFMLNFYVKGNLNSKKFNQDINKLSYNFCTTLYYGIEMTDDDNSYGTIFDHLLNDSHKLLSVNFHTFFILMWDVIKLLHHQTFIPIILFYLKYIIHYTALGNIFSIVF